MDISNEKISELLKNPEIVGMIASLASGFSSGSAESVASSENPEAEETAITIKENVVGNSSDDKQLEIPVANLTKSNAYSDRRIALLQAIKPYINDAKKDKVDSLVKAIGVAGVLNTYTGTFLGGLFGNK